MQHKIEIPYQKKVEADLEGWEQHLVAKAVDAKSMAHAPYSNFQVGCAVLLQDGAIITGNNQENAAYPSGLCAERTALFSAKSASKLPIQAIAIVATNDQGHHADAFSCGACRQVILEYANLQDTAIVMIMRSHSGHYIILKDSRDMLPFSFGASTL